MWCDVRLRVTRTVDGDSDGLRESEAVLADESRDLSELAGLEVLGGGVAILNIDNVELEIVGLCHSLDGGTAGVALENKTSQ